MRNIIRLGFVSAVALLLGTSPSLPAEDALPIVKQAFLAAEANEKLAELYAFRERTVDRRLTKKGKEKSLKSRTHEVTLLDGTEYRQLVARDGEPLSEKEQAKERRKLEKQLEKIRKEKPRQREKRLAARRKEREDGLKFIDEVSRAFDFRVIGEETVSGAETYVISAEPRADYEPELKHARVLTKLRGTLWITKADHAWVKADIETFDDFSWAVVFKLRAGAKIRFLRQFVNDEVWVMDNWYIRMRGRAALVYGINGEFTGEYSDFRKFTTDSTILQGESGVVPAGRPGV
ncbi:MAG: hypothetical protein GY716_05960 [bacterium]|nr:hypothetical protein [bacterium]